jgi:hypothetical protein
MAGAITLMSAEVDSVTVTSAAISSSPIYVAEQPISPVGRWWRIMDEQLALVAIVKQHIRVLKQPPKPTSPSPTPVYLSNSISLTFTRTS